MNSMVIFHSYVNVYQRVQPGSFLKNLESLTALKLMFLGMFLGISAFFCLGAELLNAGKVATEEGATKASRKNGRVCVGFWTWANARQSSIVVQLK